MMFKKFHRRSWTPPGILAVSAGMFLLAACSQPPTPVDQFYRLDVTAAAKSPLKLNGIVEVERFVADGLNASRPIVFTDAGDASGLQSYHYHFWSEPPSIMLQNALVRYLRQSGVAKTVVTPAHRVEPDFIVTGKITQFEHVRGPSPEVVATLELSVKNRTTDTLNILREYEIKSQAQNGTVRAAVTQFSRAVTGIFNAFVKDIK